MKKSKICFLIVLIFYSCNKTKRNDDLDIRTPSDNYHEVYKEGYLDSLFTEISEKGDTSAYNKARDIISTYYIEGDRAIFYTLKMVHIYDYPKAYYDAYIYYRFSCRDNINCQQIGIYYLLKSYEKGYQESEFDIKNIFGDVEIPNSENYLKERDSTKIFKIPIY